MPVVEQCRLETTRVGHKTKNTCEFRATSAVNVRARIMQRGSKEQEREIAQPQNLKRFREGTLAETMQIPPKHSSRLGCETRDQSADLHRSLMTFLRFSRKKTANFVPIYVEISREETATFCGGRRFFFSSRQLQLIAKHGLCKSRTKKIARIGRNIVWQSECINLNLSFSLDSAQKKLCVESKKDSKENVLQSAHE